MVVGITHDPFCKCYSWTTEEFQWRSRTKAKRVCVWCAAKRDKYLPQRGL
jgi:hypothetical protein